VQSGRRFGVLLPLLLLLVVGLAACGGDDDDDAGSSSDTTADAEPVHLRLGYFPNVTHAPALVGVEGGLFEESLGDNVTL